ncbi:MAG: trypsin-like serine protease [Xenococcaceae cyanobacterium MO_188.B29]|nr:trypsin-like serine protease [Xenococcaceae cyanobacterium MO_188.B29]
MPSKSEFPEHTPISNQPEEEAAVKEEQQVSQPPSEGVKSEKTSVKDDDTEAVKDYKRTKAAAAELWTLPESIAELHDIGEASFGPPPPIAETVHGPDDRVQITNTSVYPWRVHASLLITAADNSMWIGTGWFIGPHTLITAGHVVYIKNSGIPGRDGWVKKINVMPGRNGSTLPYGSVTSTKFHSVTGWTDSGNENYDYGAIIIPTELGNTVGWFGFGVYSDSALLSATGNISGYPGDKPTGTQWYDYRTLASVNSQKVYYDIDTAGGQSGSGVYRIINGQRYGMAIHAYGGATTNSGTRITMPVYNNMVAWKA